MGGGGDDGHVSGRPALRTPVQTQAVRGMYSLMRRTHLRVSSRLQGLIVPPALHQTTAGQPRGKVAGSRTAGSLADGRDAVRLRPNRGPSREMPLRQWIRVWGAELPRPFFSNGAVRPVGEPDDRKSLAPDEHESLPNVVPLNLLRRGSFAPSAYFSVVQSRILPSSLPDQFRQLALTCRL